MAKSIKPGAPNSQPPLRPAQTILQTPQQWSGPLPHPTALARFNAIIPNGAERIMVMVEQEQIHRLQHGNTVLEATISDTKRAHYLGGLISVLALISSLYAAMIGAHPTVSIALVSIPIASIVRAFLKEKAQ